MLRRTLRPWLWAPFILVLDFVTHAPDIPLAPFVDGPKLGMGLYESGLMAAFGIELFWGLTCVAFYGGKPSLYVAVLLFNALNFTLYTPTFVGPESFLEVFVDVPAEVALARKATRKRKPSRIKRARHALRRRAAKLLGISYSSLLRRIDAYEIGKNHAE